MSRGVRLGKVRVTLSMACTPGMAEVGGGRGGLNRAGAGAIAEGLVMVAVWRVYSAGIGV